MHHKVQIRTVGDLENEADVLLQKQLESAVLALHRLQFCWNGASFSCLFGMALYTEHTPRDAREEEPNLCSWTGGWPLEGKSFGASRQAYNDSVRTFYIN